MSTLTAVYVAAFRSMCQDHISCMHKLRLLTQGHRYGTARIVSTNQLYCTGQPERKHLLSVSLHVQLCQFAALAGLVSLHIHHA